MGSRVIVRLQDSLTALPEELKSKMRKTVEKYAHACNVTNGRPKDSNFDVTYINLSHCFVWLELNKNICHLSLIDQHNQNKPWNQLKIVNDYTLNIFSINFLQLRRTHPKPPKNMFLHCNLGRRTLKN